LILNFIEIISSDRRKEKFKIKDTTPFYHLT